jgi:glycerol-3-phosphate acyltransferase PlsY
MDKKLQRTMIGHGALVFLVGLLAGFPFVLLLTADFPLGDVLSFDVNVPGDVRAWRMAHLEGILNGIVVMLVATFMPLLNMSLKSQKIVGWALIITAWGNVIASIIGPLFDVRGLFLGGDGANSIAYLLFSVAIIAVITAMVMIARAAFSDKSSD